MVASNQNMEVENLHSILERVLDKLASLPAEQKESIAGEIQFLGSCVNDLLEERIRNGRTIEELHAANKIFAARVEKFRDIAESFQDGLIAIDQNWRITFINQRAALNGGCEPEDLIGRNIWEAFPRLQGTVLEETYRRVMAEKAPAQFEMQGLYRETWYSICVFPSTDGITVLWQDITVRKQSEKAAQEHQQQLEQLADLLDNAQEPIFVLDNDWNYIFANRNHHKNLRAEPGSLDGENFWEVNPRALGTPIEYHLRKAKEEGQPSHGRLMGIHVPVWFDFSVYPTPQGVSVFSYDRTEEVEAEQALQESEARIRKILESIHDIFFELDRDWRYTFINRRGAENFGHQPEEMIGKTLWELYPTVAGTRVEQIFRQVMADQQPAVFEHQGVITGTWYETRVYPSGTGITVYAADITARKQAEQALQLALAKMRFYGDSNLIGVVIGEEDGRLVEVNDYYLNMLGYTREEYQADGLDWRKVTAPDHLYSDENAIRELKEFGICNPYEKLYIRKDGTRIWVQLRVTLLPDGKLGAIVLDITERRRAEEELRRSEEQFAKAFQASLAGLTIAHVADGRFIAANDSFLQMTGYAREEIVGHTSVELEFLPTPEARAELIEMLAGTGQVRDLEFTLPVKAGGLVQVLVSMVVVEIDDEPCILSTFLDLTEMRRLEAQNIEAKTNLEVQHRLVEQREQERQMIARDIHDGPIQSLVSTIFNIQMTKEALRDPKMQVELNQIGLSIKNTIQELRHVVNELRPPAVLHFGLSRMIRLHCADFMEKHPEVDVDHELAEDRERMPENTTLTLYRIYQEAMNNIARHANATHINIRFSIRDDQAVLEIKDNGKGFVGTPNLVSQTAIGHYGMAGMKERAEAANGKIQIQSTPGKGTKIWVMVPVEKGELEAP